VGEIGSSKNRVKARLIHTLFGVPCWCARLRIRLPFQSLGRFSNQRSSIMMSVKELKKGVPERNPSSTESRTLRSLVLSCSGDKARFHAWNKGTGGGYPWSKRG